MTKPPLLPVLGILAVTGAVFFFSMAMPSREDPSRTHASRAQEEQRYTVEALLGVRPEVLRAIADAAERSERARETAISGSEPPGPRPPLVTMAQKGRVKAAQREFLLNPDVWTGANAEAVRAVRGPWHWTRLRWIEEIVSGNPSLASAPAVQEYRRSVDAACSDLTKLSPAAKKLWDEWEAKNWEGWKLPILPDADRFELNATALAEPGFLSRKAARMQPLLDEYEYLDDLPLEMRQRHALSGTPEADADFQQLELTAAAAQLSRVTREIETLARETAAEEPDHHTEDKGQ